MLSHRKAALFVLLGGGLWFGCAEAPPRLHPVFPEPPVALLPKGRILFVLSAASEQTLSDGSKRETGTFLGEFYEPYRTLSEQGYEVVMATVGGAKPAIDPESFDEKYWDEPAELASARRFLEDTAGLQAPMSLTSALAEADSFQGIVVPGGQGMMVDLLNEADLHALLANFGERDKPVGLICHAPALLTRLPEKGRLARRTVTSMSSFEEFYIETFVMGAKAEVRGIAGQLEEGGYEHESAFPGRAHAFRDCNLVTSQNPFSTQSFNVLYLRALTDYRRGARCVEPEER